MFSLERDKQFNELSKHFQRVFEEVEVSNEINFECYYDCIREFIQLLDILPIENLIKSSVKLKVVRLNNPHIQGFYDNRKKELVVDVNKTHSFIHELGHLINSEILDSPYYLNFEPLYLKYADNFLTYNQTEDPNYLLAPHEVFARCFEQYIAHIYRDIDTIGYPLEELEIIAQPCNYPSELSDDIIEFFDNLFKRV